MKKYILALIMPMLLAMFTACNNTVMVSSSKYLDYVEQKGVYQKVEELNIAHIYPLSKMPINEGILNQESVYKSIDEVDVTEITVVTTIPEVLNQIALNNDIGNLTATAPPEIVSSVKPPSVAWTEVEYIKTMYTIVPCTSYRYALYSSYQVTYYDVGCTLNVIGITSTGFYRLNNDRYIPCEYLSENGISEPTATSKAVVYYE